METPLIEMRGIVKIYPDGTVALRGVDFSVRPGEIHGLLGENGAGKTTLMKILAGVLRPTRGSILVEGREARIHSPMDAYRHGIGMVHQHFTLIDVFTVLDNIILGAEESAILSRRVLGEHRSRIKELIEKTGLKVPLDTVVEDLPVGLRQRVEILKVLYRNIRLLILDEPTAVLTPLEVEELFETLRRLREQGTTIIFITHKLREVKEITDRVTVMRRGRVVGVVNTSEATPQQLARMMVGREVVLRVEKPPARPESPVLRVENLWVKNELGEDAVKGVSFEVRRGEVFGIGGVEGNGQTELVEALTGLRKAEKGRVLLGGKEVTNASPSELYRMGLAHIPEDRQKLGLVLQMTVAENSILGLHRSPMVSRGLMLSMQAVRSHAERLVKEYSIVVHSIDAPVKSLSGGNQQKLVVARELSKNPVLIIAAHPTRGLDVAATEYIRNLLVRLRSQGRAVLLVTADLDELLQLSDRLAIMYEGEFMGTAKPEELSIEEIGLMMGGVRLDEARRH